MSQKTLSGEDFEEDSFWAEESFAETISPSERKEKERTMTMKHNEEMNYNCAECHCKISAHNRDWHAGRCDKCFDEMLTSRSNGKVSDQEEFKPLGSLLKEDNDSVKNLKTLFKREEEYQSYLGGIEFTFANYFLENRNLTDKEIKTVLENIKKNYLEKIDFFKTDLEKEIMLGLSLALQEESITYHELKLVFDYILWSIDNRSWMPDKQAYIKWLPYFFDLYDEKERQEYKLNITKFARRIGLSQVQLNALLQ